MSNDRDECLNQNDFTRGDQSDTEECGSTHRTFRVVEESIDTRVIEFVRVGRDEEITCKS